MNDKSQPAFPTPDEWESKPGMSLRDYFAGQALTAVLYGVSSWGPVEFKKDIDNEELAEVSYSMADAMLRERDK